MVINLLNINCNNCVAMKIHTFIKMHIYSKPESRGGDEGPQHRLALASVLLSTCTVSVWVLLSSPIHADC